MKLLEEVISFIGLKLDGNIVQARRLGKFKKPANNERRLYRPILITTNSQHFMENCICMQPLSKRFSDSSVYKTVFDAIRSRIRKEDSVKKM